MAVVIELFGDNVASIAPRRYHSKWTEGTLYSSGDHCVTVADVLCVSIECTEKEKVSMTPCQARFVDDVQSLGAKFSPTGRGQSIGMFYVPGHMGSGEGFYRFFHRSRAESMQGYIWWQHSPQSEVCRDIFRSVVKNPDNEDGSYLKAGVTSATLLRLIQRYLVEASGT